MAHHEKIDLPVAPPIVEELYPMVNLIPEIKQPFWRVSDLVVLQHRAQILRAVTTPLTREILRIVEDTLQYRKYYEEQMCQFYNYGLAFVNGIVMERIKAATWYVFALQLKCRRMKKSDIHVPHYIMLELSLHRKKTNSSFAKKTLKRIAKRRGQNFDPVQIIPLHSDYHTDEHLKAYVEIPDTRGKVNDVTVVMEIAIGERNKYRESRRIQEDEMFIHLTDEDETYLSRIKAVMEENGDSLGRITIKYIRPR